MSKIQNLSKRRWELKAKQRQIQENMQTHLVFAKFEGMWKANQQLISFLSCFQNTDSLVIEDMYGIPRQVNPQNLYEHAKQQYQYATNQWFLEWNKIVKGKE